MTITLAPEIKVGGQDLAAVWLDRLVGVRIDLQVGLVGRATLRFRDFGAALAQASLFTLEKSVTVGRAGAASPVFTGTVVGISLDQGESRQPELVVTVDDAAHKLAHGTTTKTYLNSSVSTVVGDVLRAHGLSASSAQPESATHPYLLQSGTDLDFLNEICARTGRVWWVEGASTLRFEKAGTSDTTVALVFGKDLDGFSVKATSLRPDKVQVVGWDPAQQQMITGDSATPSTKSKGDLVDPFLSDLNGGAKTLVVRDAAPMDADEATAMASSIFAAAASDGVVARGTGDFNPAIALATTVNVSDAGPASGKYLVTAIEHVYDISGFTTRFTAGPHRPRHLVDVLGVPVDGSGFTLPGVITGVVTNVADPDNAGKVKVTYATQGSTVESPWARVVTIGAGKGRGLEFQPEVNDEVLVAFEQGDTRRPLVLGGLFSAKNTLPTSPKAGNVDGSSIAYRRITSRLGHVIELADGTSEDSKYVLVKLAGGQHQLRIGADKTDLTIANKELTITNGAAKIVFSEQGDITIQGKSITLKADTTLDAQAGTKASVAGKTGVDVQGAEVKIDGQANTTVQAGAQLALKGAVVMIN
ncbi:phage baseplate assembly protein V [Nocardioides sp. BP30]|uniref:phage baseplate assembly protein V n=1 Tax=Nocardioides sp. BP30 TaxID=3036374 RepID=UPI0024699E9B|nr:phage baseplate assembly protein V [Nocardioides sp. BP30]WGL52095.1 phage baseplate assembly protein V [Nocardioides sp. BP30]